MYGLTIFYALDYRSVSTVTIRWKNGSMNGSQQKGAIFTGVVFTNCPKNGDNIQQALEHVFVVLPNLRCFSQKKKTRFSYLHTWCLK